MTKLDRLTHSVPDARDVVAELTSRGVRLEVCGSLLDRANPIGRLLFPVLSMIDKSESEADLARARTREGLAVAWAMGRPRGKRPKLSPGQEPHLVQLCHAGEHTIGELEELFAVTRSTVHRAVACAGGRAAGQGAQGVQP